MTSVRTRVKRTIECALITGGAAAVARRSRSGQLLVLAYHNVSPINQRTTGDQSLHLPQREFARQLDSLLETHDVIALKDAFPEPTAPSPDRVSRRPRAVITFDDAYTGALTAGVAELRARNLPATVFVTPSFLDGGAFWWDVLADESAGLDPNARAAALSEGRGLNTAVLQLAATRGLHAHAVPTYARGASMQDIDDALAYDGITLASHTWSHPNLTRLSDSELIPELSRPLEWLARFSTRSLRMISYPYGLADHRVQQAARSAGYTEGFMIEGGWTTRTPADRLAIPRLNVPAGVSTAGFVLRASGVFKG